MQMDTAAIFPAEKRRKEVTMSLGNQNKPSAIESYVLGATAVKERNPAAVEVAQLATRIANYAQTIAENANSKLQSVMTGETPRNCSAPCKDSEEYPPLFSDLRNSLQGIESALDNINYMLSRTEL